MRINPSFRVRHAVGALLAALLGWAGSAEATTLRLQPVATGLANPVGLVNAHDRSNRLFVVEQEGFIRILSGGRALATPFLDIRSKVLFGGERGLLGLAFDPSYSSNGFFYVYYTSRPSGTVTIARYKVGSNRNVADPHSGHILKTQVHSKFGNHNGGALAFGPDGCLYAGIGDGGSGGDPDGNGQNLGTLLAKIIRISKTDGLPCAAAPGNPFVGQHGARGEIWALGVRNPWRITFDRQTGDLLIADVGQGEHEEVDIQAPGVAGRNYCWNRKEGNAIYDADTPCTSGTPTDPIIVYDHVGGNCSITGGYRYRGSQYPALVGTYFYGDYCTGRIWGATKGTSAWTSRQLLNAGFNISSFGEDEAGEIYVVQLDSTNGAVYRLAFDAGLLVSPATNMIASGAAGGPFSPSSFSYSMRAVTGSIHYSISIQYDAGTPHWLSASSASGTVTTAPKTETFKVNSAAKSLAPGTYHATVTFTNTTNGRGIQKRSARLTVKAP